MITLYGPRLSPPYRSVQLLLEATGQPYKEVFVDFRSDTQKSEWYTKLNPMQKCPIIDDDGFVLTESAAILEYLASKEGVAAHWLPRDPKLRAKVSQYNYWHHSAGLPVSCIFRTAAVAPYLTGKPVDEQLLKGKCLAMNKTLDLIENYFFASGTFLAGDDITIADLLAAGQIAELEALGFCFDAGRPRLATWWANTKARLQPHFDKVNEPLFKFAKPYKGNADNIC